MLVFMTGMMGSGKTSVARRLASITELLYEDLDHVLESREGKAISQIFREQGESYFRRKEQDILREYCQKTQGIYALGGGALCSEEAWTMIPQHGNVIWLKARPETLIERLQGDESRPLLNNDLEAQVNRLTNSRKGWYERARFHVETDGKSPNQIAEELHRILGNTSQ